MSKMCPYQFVNKDSFLLQASKLLYLTFIKVLIFIPYKPVQILHAVYNITKLVLLNVQN